MLQENSARTIQCIRSMLGKDNAESPTVARIAACHRFCDQQRTFRADIQTHSNSNSDAICNIRLLPGDELLVCPTIDVPMELPHTFRVQDAYEIQHAFPEPN